MTWEQIANTFKDAEAHKERTRADISSAYQVQLHIFKGFSSMKQLSLHNTSYEFRVSFYDTVYKQFIGRTWKSKLFVPTAVEGSAPQLHLNQSLYFHTPYVDSTIICVVEIVKIMAPKNPLPGQPVLTNASSLGWGIIRVFKSDLTMSAQNVEAVQKGMTVYHGSPRALLFMDDNIESNTMLQPVPGCQLTYNFKKHPPLNKVFHLMPENVIFSGSDYLPGMAELMAKEDQEPDNFFDPRPLKKQTCYIDNLAISFGDGTTVEKFEETLCQKINKDRFLKDMSQDDGKTVVVTERRLMIGVHNGYCYVHKPQFFQLEPESLLGSRTGSFGRGKRKEPTPANKSSTCLVLRSRVNLDEMMRDPEVAIVMQIEYQLSVPYSSQASIRGSVSSLQNQPLSVSVRWAALCPFAHEQESNVYITALKGPMASNPDNVLFYSFHNSPDEDLGKIKFKFLTSQPTDSFQNSIAQSTLNRMAAKPPIHPQSPALSAGRIKSGGISRQLIDEQFDSSHRVEITHMEMEDELPPVHAPPLQPIAQRTPGLSRAAYARLYSSGFPVIKDRSGKPATTVDPLDDNLPLDVAVELQDILGANEIVLQFLAFSRPAYGPGEARQSTFSSMFCSFQFYRFEAVTTNRMSLSKNINNATMIFDDDKKHDSLQTFILRKVHGGNQIDKGPPGLEVRYLVDPAQLKPGEHLAFLKYLMDHSLHVDVWDGDSLLLIGSFAMPLKHLLRQRHSAVSVNHEISVISEENTSIVPKMTNDANLGMKSVGVTKTNKGRIYIRLGSIGHASEGRAVYDDDISKQNLVIADMSGCTFLGGSLSTARSNLQTPMFKGRNFCHVKRVVDCNKEISELLLTNQDATTTHNEITNGILDKSSAKETPESVRKRKLARMLAIRDMEKDAGKESGTTLGRRALVKTQERSLKLRDLEVVDSYRSRLKSDHIREILLLSITTQHTIRPSFGVTEFVELQIKNPFTSEHTITIETDHPDLRVVTDAREWRYFKSLSNLRTPVEENMFSCDNANSLPQVFMRAKETLFIPFRFQSFSIEREVAAAGPSQFFQPTQTSIQPTRGKNHGTIKSKIVKAILRTGDGKPLSVLQLNIEPQPHVIDQTFRFYNPESTFMKKCIRLPPLSQQISKEYSDASRLHVECSDAEVVCQTVAKNSHEPQEVFIKASCGKSPTIRRFFLALFNDPFLSLPTQVWQIYAHALNRIDVSCVLGQKSKLSIVLRGTQTTRLVKCYPSHPQLMELSPSDSFMLSSNQMTELTVYVRPTSASTSKHMHIHVVDVEYHQLVQAWLVVANTKQPIIEKEFDVSIASSGGQDCCKSISYTNPYSVRKRFHVMTSRPDLMSFVDGEFELPPGDKFAIGMRITSRAYFDETQQIYVFINDEEDKTEETFVINANYA